MSEEYIFGWHAVEAVLKREPERIQQVWIQTGREDRRVKTVTDAFNELGVRWKVVHRKELDQRVAGVHQALWPRFLKAVNGVKMISWPCCQGLTSRRFC